MTQEAIAGAPTTGFRIGRVLSVSLRVLLRNFAPFILLSLICSIPSLIFNYENPAVQRILTGDVGALPAPDQLGHRYLYSALSLVVSTLCYALTQSALIFGTIQDLSGQRAGFSQILSRGLATMLPVLGAAVLMTLGMMAGALLLVIPGLILFVMWWVTIPALVTERLAISAAFGRSRQLTKGHRWGIFGLFFLVGVIQQAAAYLIGAIAGIFLVSGGFNTVIAAGVLGGMIVAFIFSAYYAVMTAVGYYYLRAEKEGIAIGDIARVFD